MSPPAKQPDSQPEAKPDSPSHLHECALEAARAGDYPEAAALWSRAIAAHGDEPTYHSNLGSVLHLMGEWQPAAAAHERAIELGRARMAWYHYNLGVTLCASGQLARAEAAYRRALEHDPDMVLANINLGTMLQRDGRLDAAEAAYLRALEHAPHEIFALRNLGSVLAALGRMDEAEAAYRDALERAPEDADLHCDLGALAHAGGKLDQAIHAYQHACTLAPELVRAHIQGGVVLATLGRLDEARAAHERALELAPSDPATHSAMGATLAGLGEYDDAITAFERALEISASLYPDSPKPHYNLGAVLHRAGQLELAVDAYRAALERAPEHIGALGNLADCLRRLERYNEAEATYHTLLSLRPDDASARHLAAALAGETRPQPPPGYVREVFDDYAPRFERHLVDELGYRVPEELAHAIEAERTSRALPNFAAILDLGCGTGLLGPHLGRFGRPDVPDVIVHGVDLSSAMLAQAEDKGVYQVLYRRDLCEFLADETAGLAHYQLITAADVLIYVGALERVFAGVRERLEPGGLFAFTIEEATGGAPLELRPTGRYAHSREYIETLAREHDLLVHRAAALVLRQEHDHGEHGVLYILERAVARPSQ